MPRHKGLLALDKFIELMMGGRQPQPLPPSVIDPDPWWDQYTRQCDDAAFHRELTEDAERQERKRTADWKRYQERL